MTRRDRRKDYWRRQADRFKNCEWCKERFEAYKPEHRFCCKGCNNAWHAAYRKQQNDNSVYVPPELRPQIKEMVKDWLAQPDCKPIQLTQPKSKLECPEDEPNFKPSFISKSEPRLNKPSWQCTQCGDYFHSSPCPNCIDKPKQTEQKDMTLTPDGGIDDDPPY